MEDVLVEGDRVLISERDRACENYYGDTGVLRFHSRTAIGLYLDSGAVTEYEGYPASWMLDHLELGYVIPLARAQGEEYDDVLIPIPPEMEGHIKPRDIYSAISRARKRVILYGDPAVLEHTLKEGWE